MLPTLRVRGLDRDDAPLGRLFRGLHESPFPSAGICGRSSQLGSSGAGDGAARLAATRASPRPGIVAKQAPDDSRARTVDRAATISAEAQPGISGGGGGVSMFPCEAGRNTSRSSHSRKNVAANE